MALHMLLTTETAEPSTIGTFLDTLIHEDLSTFAVWVWLMAFIWIACAAITLAGAFTGTVVVAALRATARSCADYLRRRWDVADDQPVTVDVDEAQATITDLEPYRASREHHQPEDAEADDRLRGDDPDPA